MTMVIPSFLLHGLVSLPASLNFLSLALSIPSTTPLFAGSSLETRPIILSYASLLTSTCIVSCVLGLTNPGELSYSTVRFLALGMAVYHVGPIMRAVGRLRSGSGKKGRELGGAWVHLAAHVVVVTSLAMTAFT